MVQSANKTVPTAADVATFLAAVPDPRRREEGHLVDALHRRVTGCAPRLWGTSLVGYGAYRYRYESGREGEAMRAGFSPRKAAMTIYLMGPDLDRTAQGPALFARLGPHKTGTSCLYLPRLDRIDTAVLEAIVALSWDAMNRKYPEAQSG